jgi:hypothetical protein
MPPSEHCQVTSRILSNLFIAFGVGALPKRLTVRWPWAVAAVSFAAAMLCVEQAALARPVVSENDVYFRRFRGADEVDDHSGSGRSGSGSSGSDNSGSGSSGSSGGSSGGSGGGNSGSGNSGSGNSGSGKSNGGKATVSIKPSSGGANNDDDDRFGK